MKDDMRKDETSRARFPESVGLAGRRRETARQEFASRAGILALLAAKGALTVPEIARELGMPAREVHWWLMGFQRYAKVRASERADDEGYYRYSLVEVK
jgi:DNA-directed RNA polymerase specialized sigma subunit